MGNFKSHFRSDILKFHTFQLCAIQMTWSIVQNKDNVSSLLDHLLNKVMKPIFKNDWCHPIPWQMPKFFLCFEILFTFLKKRGIWIFHILIFFSPSVTFMQRATINHCLANFCLFAFCFYKNLNALGMKNQFRITENGTATPLLPLHLYYFCK